MIKKIALLLVFSVHFAFAEKALLLQRQAFPVVFPTIPVLNALPHNKKVHENFTTEEIQEKVIESLKLIDDEVLKIINESENPITVAPRSLDEIQEFAVDYKSQLGVYEEITVLSGGAEVYSFKVREENLPTYDSQIGIRDNKRKYMRSISDVLDADKLIIIEYQLMVLPSPLGVTSQIRPKINFIIYNRSEDKLISEDVYDTMFKAANGKSSSMDHYSEVSVRKYFKQEIRKIEKIINKI